MIETKKNKIGVSYVSIAACWYFEFQFVFYVDEWESNYIKEKSQIAFKHTTNHLRCHIKKKKQIQKVDKNLVVLY